MAPSTRTMMPAARAAMAVVAAAAAAVLALALASAQGAEATAFSTVCSTPVSTLTIPNATLSLFRQTRNPVTGKFQAFWVETVSEFNSLLWTSPIPTNVSMTDASALSPVLVSNTTIINEYKVVTSEATRTMVVVLNSDSGFNYRQSTDGGATWGGVDYSDGKYKAADVAVSRFLYAVTDFDAIYTGNEFLIVALSNTAYGQTHAFAAYISPQGGQVWGFNPSASTYDGVYQVTNDTTVVVVPYGSGMAPVEGATVQSLSSIAAASDSKTVLVAYEDSNHTVEIQAAAVGTAQSKSFTSVGGILTTFLYPSEYRHAMSLSASGTVGTFVLASILFSDDATTFYNAVSQVTTDSGKTWSAMRPITLGFDRSGGSAPAIISANFFSSFLVVFLDRSNGLTANDNTFKAVVSTSSSGYVWTTREVLYDAGNAASLSNIQVAKFSASAYGVGFDLQGGGGGFAYCGSFNPQAALASKTSGAAAAGAGAARVGAALVAGALAVLMTVA